MIVSLVGVVGLSWEVTCDIIWKVSDEIITDYALQGSEQWLPIEYSKYLPRWLALTPSMRVICSKNR